MSESKPTSEEIAAKLRETEIERDELQATFDLRWECDMRAIKQWRAAHPGNDRVWPDHADLCVWLVDQLTEAQADSQRLAAENKRLAENALMREALEEIVMKSKHHPECIGLGCSCHVGVALAALQRAPTPDLGEIELAENARMREALTRYADAANWVCSRCNSGDDDLNCAMTRWRGDGEHGYSLAVSSLSHAPVLDPEPLTVICNSCGGTQIYERDGNTIRVLHDCCARYGSHPSSDRYGKPVLDLGEIERALEPFARYASQLNSPPNWMPDGCPINVDPDGISDFTVGQVRRVAAVLAKLREANRA